MYNAFPIQFNHDGRQLTAEVKPLAASGGSRQPTKFQIFINNMYYGLVQRSGDRWETNSAKCGIMVDQIGVHIRSWYDENY